ncbi:MAG: hypothetical protein JJT95_02220 [Pararhodobacter sp.]|nr:hypothetical protein [Pararhodobacter sp.]
MSFAIPAARSLRMIFNLGFDRVWFALAVVACLFLASWLSDQLLQWFVIGPGHPIESILAS